MTFWLGFGHMRAGIYEMAYASTAETEVIVHLVLPFFWLKFAIRA